jgi:hypothetical protein
MGKNTRNRTGKAEPSSDSSRAERREQPSRAGAGNTAQTARTWHRIGAREAARIAAGELGGGGDLDAVACRDRIRRGAVADETTGEEMEAVV